MPVIRKPMCSSTPALDKGALEKNRQHRLLQPRLWRTCLRLHLLSCPFSFLVTDNLPSSNIRMDPQWINSIYSPLLCFQWWAGAVLGLGRRVNEKKNHNVWFLTSRSSKTDYRGIRVTKDLSKDKIETDVTPKDRVTGGEGLHFVRIPVEKKMWSIPKGQTETGIVWKEEWDYDSRLSPSRKNAKHQTHCFFLAHWG